MWQDQGRWSDRIQGRSPIGGLSSGAGSPEAIQLPNKVRIHRHIAPSCRESDNLGCHSGWLSVVSALLLELISGDLVPISELNIFQIIAQG